MTLYNIKNHFPPLPSFHIQPKSCDCNKIFFSIRSPNNNCVVYFLDNPSDLTETALVKELV